MKDSYKCYEKVLIVIVTAIVLCFSVHVRASGVGNKESAQEIVNEYFSLIGNDWDKFAELYTNEQINSFKNFLENEKNIREYVGVLNVRKAKLIESIEIKNGNKTLLYENGFLYNSSQTLIMCCSKEKDITVPEGIKTIGALSFKQATNVENVVFPDSLVSIQDRVFEGASNIKRIDMLKILLLAKFKDSKFCYIIILRVAKQLIQLNNNYRYSDNSGSDT